VNKKDQESKYREVKALLDSFLHISGRNVNAASILDEFDPSKRQARSFKQTTESKAAVKRNVRPSTKPILLEKKKTVKKPTPSPAVVQVKKEKERQKLRIEIDK